MGEFRKITVQVDRGDLEMAQELTGQGVTETIRQALKRLASVRAQHQARQLRGSFQFTVDLDQLREDRKW
jgi:hypothetical protein